jgi:hypothetical protein
MPTEVGIPVFSIRGTQVGCCFRPSERGDNRSRLSKIKTFGSYTTPPDINGLRFPKDTTETPQHDGLPANLLATSLLDQEPIPQGALSRCIDTQTVGEIRFNRAVFGLHFVER